MEPRDRHTFTRRERLKTSSDFRRCIRAGARAARKHIVVCLAENDLGITRLGAASTRRLGDAPSRNRAKRLVREAFRLTKHLLPTGVDIVVLPKVPWGEPTLEQLKDELVRGVQTAAGKLDKKKQP